MDYTAGRAPRGCTKDPCPGCGSTGLRKKDRVCQACADKLEHFDDLEKAAKERGEIKPFVLKERAYALPYLHHIKDDKELKEKFWNLSMLLSTPTKEHAPYDERNPLQWWVFKPTNSMSGYDWKITRLMDAAVATTMSEIYSGVAKGLHEAHAKGFAEGRNLLMSLASGNLTTDEFNDRAARIEKRDEPNEAD